MKTKLVRWNEVEREQLHPLLDRQFINGQNVTLARILLRKGMLVPQHVHENEQLAYVVEGALKFIMPEEEVIVRSGEVLVIPPNVPHAAEALEDTLDLDIFVHVRIDWVNKQDAYLRGR